MRTDARLLCLQQYRWPKFGQIQVLLGTDGDLRVAPVRTNRADSSVPGPHAHPWKPIPPRATATATAASNGTMNLHPNHPSQRVQSNSSPQFKRNSSSSDMRLFRPLEGVDSITTERPVWNPRAWVSYRPRSLKNTAPGPGVCVTTTWLPFVVALVITGAHCPGSERLVLE